LPQYISESTSPAFSLEVILPFWALKQ